MILHTHAQSLCDNKNTHDLKNAKQKPKNRTLREFVEIDVQFQDEIFEDGIEAAAASVRGLVRYDPPPHIHMWDMTHSYVRHDLFIRVHDSFVYDMTLSNVTRLIHM